MSRYVKILVAAVCLGLGLRTAHGFALLKPILGTDAWMSQANGFNPVPIGSGFFPLLTDGKSTGPAMLGEGFRRNNPVIYYSANQPFRKYFGATGVREIEKAFDYVNSLTNVSQYSRELTEFPLQSKRQNYFAEILGLIDLKTLTLEALMEELGLAEPDRYAWVIHQRVQFAGNPQCPGNMGYVVFQMNYDPVPSLLNGYQRSSFVNGTLYSYFIQEICTPEQGGPPTIADALEFPVDPLATMYTAVASRRASLGEFYTSLTRDDVGAIRYHLSTNNFLQLEPAGAGVVGHVTNTAAATFLVTSNLSLFAAQAQTNSAATLQGLYPGLVITSTSNYFGLVVTTNVTAIFTNSPQAPVGSPALLTFTTNYVTNIVQFFQHTFANIITNQSAPRGFVRVETTSVTSPVGAPAGTNGVLITNITSQVVLTNTIQGDFFIVPAGLCAIDILTNLLATVVTTTNTVTLTVTNAPGVTNVGNQSFTQNIITFFTNHTLVYFPVTCPTNPVAEFQGIDHIRFVHVDDELLDPLTGVYKVPFTNEYTMMLYTNHAFIPMRMQRVVTQPDILFDIQDLVGGPAGGAITISTYNYDVPWNTGNVPPGHGGPGTIDSTGGTNTTIVFNQVAPVYATAQNQRTAGDSFLDTEALQTIELIYGSFDTSTNAPIVYPAGSSFVNLLNQLMFQLTPPPPVLPSARVGVAYHAQFSASGGQAPYTWSLSPNSTAGLPAGMSIAANGTISGTPTTDGTFDFVIRLTDGSGRTADYAYFITINP